MRITESFLRRIIREELLNEDLEGFIRKTSDIYYTGDYRDPSLEGDYNKSLGIKQKARRVKQIWAEEADHDFMDSVIKVHWLKKQNVGESLSRFLSMSRKNEISTMGYLPGTSSFRSSWGPLGVVVKGHTTLAANEMLAIYSGYAGRLDPGENEKHKRSGTRKRPTAFYGGVSPAESRSHEYILDRSSFDRKTVDHNEFIIASWEPVGIVFSEEFLDVLADAVESIERGQFEPWYSIAKAFVDSGLPALSEHDEAIARSLIANVTEKQAEGSS